MRIRLIFLLAAALFLAEVVPAPAQVFFRGRGRRTPWSLNAWMSAGGRGVAIDDLNDRLDAAGYEEFGQSFLAMSGGLELSIRRLILGWEGTALLTDGQGSDNGLIATELYGGEALFNVGYRVVSRDRFSIFPMVGAGAGTMQISFLPATAGSFNDILTNPQRMARMYAVTALVNVGAGLEYMMPVLRLWRGDGGILLGLRAGYIFSPFSSNWRFENTSIAGGPDLDMSGPYVRGQIGVGVDF